MPRSRRFRRNSRIDALRDRVHIFVIGRKISSHRVGSTELRPHQRPTWATSPFTNDDRYRLFTSAKTRYSFASTDLRSYKSTTPIFQFAGGGGNFFITREYTFSHFVRPPVSNSVEIREFPDLLFVVFVFLPLRNAIFIRR